MITINLFLSFFTTTKKKKVKIPYDFMGGWGGWTPQGGGLPPPKEKTYAIYILETVIHSNTK